MNNIYTELDTLLKCHLDDEFEISEMLDLPVVSIRMTDGTLEVSDVKYEKLVEDLHWEELFKEFHRNFTVVAYVYKDTIIVCQIFDEDGVAWSRKRLDSFVDLYNLNPFDKRIKKIAVHDFVLKLKGVKDAIDAEDSNTVGKKLIKELTDMCLGISRVTGGVRKGLVFKSPNFAFKVYSEDYLKSLT